MSFVKVVGLFLDHLLLHWRSQMKAAVMMQIKILLYNWHSSQFTDMRKQIFDN